MPPPTTGVPGGGPAPSAEATGVLKEAEDQYKAEKYKEAANTFHAVASGKTPGDVARGQFWLGKSLYKLEFYAASLAVFNDIVKAGPSHPYHKLTLPWLASLSRELPEGAGVLEKVGTYKPADLEDSAFDEVRDELYYLLGRFFYQKGDLAQAISLLGHVPDNSDYYIPAQFFLGVAETREYHGKEAVDAFKNVLRKNIQLKEAAEKDKKKKKKEAKARVKAEKKRNKAAKKSGKAIVETVSYEEEMDRFEERANLSLGYIFYQVGKFETAIKYFDKVPLESPYWLDSILASAWSEFRLVEAEPEQANLHYQRTLGYIHTLNAPFFYDYLYPESVILKAVTYYFNCRYGPAKRAVEEFNRRYPKTRNDLKELLAKAPEDFALYDLSVKIRNGDSGLDPFVEEVAQKTLQDKTIEKTYAYVAELEREQEVFESMANDFKSSDLGDRISEDIDTALSQAKETTGALARQRLTAQINEINALEREAIKIEYEILNRIKAGGEGTPTERRPDKPKIDSEHEIYNYNGEYWKDELGYYNYKVTSLCKEE
ncbi:MAG: tetratricopeptide repeat protein [Myxococcales bacterium]|nr:tetratricopeptide repeat protein [Myxococcales bacterium]MCB9706030.1 tetratricopeptide repeat protein [Myxococcales bacterium]